MATGRPRNLAGTLAPWLVLAALSPMGCAQPGPFAARQSKVGSLKASVSQLEFDNDKLRKEVADLKADNSRLDTQLAQERDANGEMSARLDDAKVLIRRQGGNAQAPSMGGPSRNFEDDNIPPPVATPKGRRMNGSRPPPAVRIPQIEPAIPFGGNGEDVGYRPSTRAPRDLGPLDDGDDDRWLPVARGRGSPVRQ